MKWDKLKCGSEDCNLDHYLFMEETTGRLVGMVNGPMVFGHYEALIGESVIGMYADCTSALEAVSSAGDPGPEFGREETFARMMDKLPDMIMQKSKEVLQQIGPRIVQIATQGGELVALLSDGNLWRMEEHEDDNRHWHVEWKQLPLPPMDGDCREAEAHLADLLRAESQFDECPPNAQRTPETAEKEKE